MTGGDGEQRSERGVAHPAAVKAEHELVGRVPQASPFCPNIAATPDGTQVWFTLKDTGKTEVFNAQPPFNVLRTIDTGPITNHVNIVRNAHGQFAYVTVGGLNEVKVFHTDDFGLVATIPVGKLPHGIWPSGDGTRVYIGLEIDDKATAIDTLTNTVIATAPIGQAPQGVAYVPNAVPERTGPELGNNAMSSAGAGMLGTSRNGRAAASRGRRPSGPLSAYDGTTGRCSGRRPAADQCEFIRSRAGAGFTSFGHRP